MIREFRRPRPTPAGVILVALSSYAPNLGAQMVNSSARAEAADLPAGLAASLAAIVLCGALGAFAADLVTNGGRLDRWTTDTNGWGLGFLAKLVIGSVASLILLTLNPPGGSWLTLIGTGITAGVGGEALLLSIMARRRAEEAERETQAAVEAEQRTSARTHATLRTVRDRLMAHGGEGDRGGDEPPSFSFKSGSPASEPALALLTIDDALSAIAAEARSSVTDTVRGILKRVLRVKDVDKRKLKDMGGAVHREMIATDIARTWEGQFSRPFTDSDVSGDDTLATLAKKVRDLLV
jgi:hypothetical protein